MRSAVRIQPFALPVKTSSFSFTEDDPDEQLLNRRQHEWEDTTSVDASDSCWFVFAAI